MGFTIGILQYSSSTNPRENIKNVSRIIEERHRYADLIVLPEYSMFDILLVKEPDKAYELAEEIDNSLYLSSLSDLSSKLGIYILTHFIERSSNPPKTYSDSILIEPSGSYKLMYRKIHLFDAYGYRESNYFIPGDKPSEKLVLNKVSLRIAICFDIRFPELFRIYALEGADAVIVHAGWVTGSLKEETLEFLARSRAHENGSWIIIADQYGENYVGRSMIVNPYGVKEVDLGVGVKYVEHYIDENIVREVREKIPVLEKARSNWRIEFIR